MKSTDDGDAAKPWWSYRAPGEVAFADVSARHSRRNGRPQHRSNGDRAPAVAGDETEVREAPRSIARPPQGSGLIAGVIAGLTLLIVLAAAQAQVAAVAGRVLLPIFGIAAAAAVAPRLARRHPDEPWLPRLLVGAMAFKLLMTYLRYQVFQGSGDAMTYDRYGRQYVAGVAKALPDKQKTNFIKWLTGIVYAHFGVDIIVGFFVFGLIAFVGSYFWYRATVVGVPFIDKRLYFLFVFFAPSVAFWPASIGKEAIMQFAMGLAAFGTAWVLTGRFLRGILIAAPGAYLMWFVRPHLLAFMTLAAGAAYVVGRAPRRKAEGVSVFRPLGMIAIAFFAVFAATQAASLLGMNGLSLKSINQELADVNGSTSQEGSKFDTGNTNLTPLSVPKGLITVLLRPFPNQVENKNQLIASAECAFIVIYAFHRRRSVKLALTRARTTPYLFFCWTLVLVYATAFSSIANMGLLTRQRSLVLPALYVLFTIDPIRAERQQPAVRATV
jgi:hypothetical protein